MKIKDKLKPIMMSGGRKYQTEWRRRCSYKCCWNSRDREGEITARKLVKQHELAKEIALAQEQRRLREEDRRAKQQLKNAKRQEENALMAAAGADWMAKQAK